MLTVLEAIKLSTEFLGSKGIESPRINAELLLSNVLKCKRLNLYLTFDRPLAESEVTLYRELIRRRGKAEPLQYIIGEVEFYGLPIKVNKSVLIPRPETEILVESVIEYSKSKGKLNILDIGTGSGNISIALAMNIPEVSITAVDSSPDAVNTARENSILNGISGQINFIVTDILDNQTDILNGFDVIVSNPPYISKTEYETLRPELKIYEPGNALTDYADGFSFFTSISSISSGLLKQGGRLFFEMGEGQSSRVEQILISNSFKDITIKKDYLNIDRVISGVKN